MSEQTIAEQAERLTRRRARLWPVLAILFISQQAIYFSEPARAGGAVDHVHIAAWMVLSIVLLLVLVTGGGWIYPKAVRDLANDEVTRAHRNTAFRSGFLAAMLGCVALYVIDLYEPMTGREAIHLVMTIGIGAALMRFGMLERRSQRDG